MTETPKPRSRGRPPGQTMDRRIVLLAPSALVARLEERAAAEGKLMSVLVRDALQRYLAEDGKG